MSAEVRTVLGKISADQVENLFLDAGVARPALLEDGKIKRTVERYTLWSDLPDGPRLKIQLACTRVDQYRGEFASTALWTICCDRADLMDIAQPDRDVQERALALLLRSPTDFHRADSIRQSMRRRDRQNHSRFRNLQPGAHIAVDATVITKIEQQIHEIRHSLDGAGRRVEIDHFEYFANEKDRADHLSTLHIMATVEGAAESRHEREGEEFEYVLRRPANTLSIDYCAPRGLLDVAGRSVGAYAVRQRLAHVVADAVASPSKPALVVRRDYDLDSFRTRRPLPIDEVPDLLSAKIVRLGHRGPESGAGASTQHAGDGEDVWDRLEALGVPSEMMAEEEIFMIGIELHFDAEGRDPVLIPVEIRAPNHIDLSKAGEYKDRLLRAILPTWGLDAEDLIELEDA